MKLELQALAAALALTLAFPLLAETTDDTGSQTEPLAYYDVYFSDTTGAESIAEAAEPQVTFKYFFVPAVAFNRRSDTISSTYSSGGCISSHGGYMVADIQIEDGATIEGMRIYYHDTDASNAVTGVVTSYNGAGDTNDHFSVHSTVQAGYGTAYTSAPDALVVDNFARSYVMNVMQTGTSSLFCGARLFYSIP